MALKKRKRFNLKYFFYWVIAISFVVWAWTFLYLHSINNNIWGKHDLPDEVIQRRNAECYNVVANLEAFNAPAAELYTNRMHLAGLYNESKEYARVRQTLDKQDATDKNEPESRELLERRLKVEEFRARTYLGEGKFGEPRLCYKRALSIAATIAEKYSAVAGKLYKASLTNEIGIVDYLEGSCLISTNQRKGLFDSSREHFNDAIEQIECLNAADGKDGLKLDAAARQLAADIKRHARANLALVEEDQRFESMFQKS